MGKQAPGAISAEPEPEPEPLTLNGSRLVTLQAAATSAGVHQDTLRRRNAEGALPFYKMSGGRIIRVRMADVAALFQVES